mmetsp:Transcript_8459/g.18961  ORF Transcript_8459/g.18961 Transcript_8459/m.18961 type:complete len:136 (-) Transcript_8459:101-508(-)
MTLTGSVWFLLFLVAFHLQSWKVSAAEDAGGPAAEYSAAAVYAATAVGNHLQQSQEALLGVKSSTPASDSEGQDLQEEQCSAHTSIEGVASEPGYSWSFKAPIVALVLNVVGTLVVWLHKSHRLRLAMMMHLAVA